MRLAFALLTVALAWGSRSPADDPPKPAAPEAQARAETEALAFVREHHPELATVVEALKPMDPAEYRKAIGELSGVARSLAPLRERNPRRHAIALDEWKARSRVELLAARLAGAPTEEKLSELRLAIEAKVAADIARQRFDLEQAEAAAKRARSALDRLETHRDEIIEARLRALRPKKAAVKAKPKAQPIPKPATTTDSPAATPEGTRR